MGKIQLSDSEWKIMNQLWEEPYLTITQLTAGLQAETGWDKHTVITLLSRIEKKGGVSYRKEGRAKKFFTIVSRADVATRETKNFLDKVYQGSLSMMVHSMVEKESLSEKEIEELYQLIKEAKEKQK